MAGDTGRKSYDKVTAPFLKISGNLCQCGSHGQLSPAPLLPITTFLKWLSFLANEFWLQPFYDAFEWWAFRNNVCA